MRCWAVSFLKQFGLVWYRVVLSVLYGVMLCCVVQCCVVLCRIVLCCVVL